MEKYSQFRDPVTGIHPFTNPKYRSIRLEDIPKLITRLILLPFALFFPSLLTFYIKIQKADSLPKKGIYICNRTSIFDKFILSRLFQGCNFYYLTIDGFQCQKKNVKRLNRNVLNIVFPEECGSNNSCIMRFVRDIDFDGIIGLKYSNSCIFMYGNIYKFLGRFFASKNTLMVSTAKTSDIKDVERVIGLPHIASGKKEYDLFMEYIKKNNK